MFQVPMARVEIEGLPVASTAELFHWVEPPCPPPERIAINDFLYPRQSAYPINDNRLQVELPRWKTRRLVALRASLTILIDPSTPANLFVARADFGQNLRAEWLYVLRPSLRYVMSAGYLFRNSISSSEVTCYFLRFTPLSAEVGPFQTFERLLTIEATHQAHRGRRRELTLSQPVLRRFLFETEDRRTRVQRDLVTSESTFWNRPGADRSRSNVRIGQELLKIAHAGLATPRGATPRHDEEGIQTLFRELTPLCEQILLALPRPKWPAFRSRAGSKSFILDHYLGEPEMVAALVEILMQGIRRPTAIALARKVIARVAYLSPKRVREITRT